VSGNNFIIRWTRHGLERALERDVTEILVKYVINNPIDTIYDAVRENCKSYAQVRHPNSQQWSI
jgi:hypothetical protein